MVWSVAKIVQGYEPTRSRQPDERPANACFVKNKREESRLSRSSLFLSRTMDTGYWTLSSSLRTALIASESGIRSMRRYTSARRSCGIYGTTARNAFRSGCEMVFIAAASMISHRSSSVSRTEKTPARILFLSSGSSTNTCDRNPGGSGMAARMLSASPL
jgi:hypothetical protein